MAKLPQAVSLLQIIHIKEANTNVCNKKGIKMG